MSAGKDYALQPNSTAHEGNEYIEEVNLILDTIRSKILQHRPKDICNFINTSAQQMAASRSLRGECKDIILKISGKIMESPLSIIIFGASGDLAKKKTFPALFDLYCDGLLPPEINIVGYARTKIQDIEKWKNETLAKYFDRLEKHRCHLDSFFRRLSYISGSYDNIVDFKRLDEHLIRLEDQFSGTEKNGNRLFYLALPPSVFVCTCNGIRRAAMPRKGGWVRVVIEKPFGHDTESSSQLSHDLETLFDESQIFRIDHYLGKEIVQNILTTRFANRIFSSTWNSSNVACVRITFKETIGVEGRAGYFDSYGIIRDVIQNHLTQMLALISMEKPRTLDTERIRDEKVFALRCIAPVRKEDCVLGQYTASKDGSIPDYRAHPGVPENSRCPTFACMVLHINNDRWNGVPFILKAGKALEDKGVNIIIQFKDEIHPYQDAAKRDELVICAQPSEAIYLNLTMKNPGVLGKLTDTHQTELALTYRSRYDVRFPDAYESLINDAIHGNSTNFVRKDELDAAWRIFTPLLQQIDQGAVDVIPYVAGTRGPKEADELIFRNGFKYAKHCSYPLSENKL
ncbi:unnamed protein product [Phytomonas sp. EM1]|nr:unnamed protein product [Phytomonas sp. EM1]|eukprot:CCW60472.1 unnamed protein product [Phytomonas sp. isolate EM1]